VNDADDIPDEDMVQLKFIISHQTYVKKGSKPIYYIHHEKYQTVNHQMQCNLFDDQSRSETVPTYTKVPPRGYKVQVKLATHIRRDICIADCSLKYTKKRKTKAQGNLDNGYDCNRDMFFI
jgi:hypothetical protein